MSRIGLRDERLERLAAMVARQGVLKLRAVANDLGVSQMTVRREPLKPFVPQTDPAHSVSAML